MFFTAHLKKNTHANSITYILAGGAQQFLLYRQRIDNLSYFGCDSTRIFHLLFLNQNCRCSTIVSVDQVLGVSKALVDIRLALKSPAAP